ncbi:MAG: hypothetical protein OER90_02070 [Gemmatimonadota bacterium]|nr:hypothetical protein [Gemmatimonadota bacterium]
MASSTRARSGIGSAMLWMFGLSLALFWIPFVGALIAGFVGGRKAGGVLPAIAAVFLPGILLFLITAVIGTLIGWVPLLGQLWAVLAGMGMQLLSLVNALPLLLGAVLGGATAKR